MIALLTSVCASHGKIDINPITLIHSYHRSFHTASHCAIQVQKVHGLVHRDLLLGYLYRHIRGYNHFCHLPRQYVPFVHAHGPAPDHWRRIGSETFYSDLLHICASLGTTQLAAPIWYAPAAFETFIFGLTAYRAWHDAKVISGPASAPLLVLFYRGKVFRLWWMRCTDDILDGMIAFFVMTGMRVWNIWVVSSPLSSRPSLTLLHSALLNLLATSIAEPCKSSLK